MSNYDQRGQNVHNQFNADQINIHFLSEYVPVELQNFEQLANVLNVFEGETLTMVEKMNIFSNDLSLVIDKIKQYSKEDLRSKMQIILGRGSIDLLRYGLFLSKKNNEYEMTLKYTERGLQNFFKLGNFDVYIYLNELLDFISKLDVIEDKVLVFRKTLESTIVSLNKMLVPQQIFEDLNHAVKMCIVEIQQLKQLMDETFQVLWRTRGTAEGLARIAK